MKTLLISFALMCGAMFTSCGTKNAEQVDSVDTTSVDSIDTMAVDSMVVDTLIADSTVMDTTALSLLNK